jgi:uncharacterized membrane protein SpoIIM required for sporulation
MSKKTRLAAFAVFFGIFLLSYTIGTTYKMSDEESKEFLKDFQNQTHGIDAVGIFSHNTSVALPMFIPAFGMAWGSFTGWQTGAAFEAVSPSSNLPPIALLLATPFGIMELVAYSIGMSRSLLLIWKIIKNRSTLKGQIKPTVIEVGIVVALLLIGGFVESSMIPSQHVSLSA